ncbi:RNA polymerase subunit sigma-24, partial [Actinoplanes sp. NPDC024001]
ALLATLAPDVVTYGDGGGKAPALATPLAGREQVAGFLIGLFRRIAEEGVRLRPAWVNGRPGAVLHAAGGAVLSVLALDVADGRIQTIQGIVNPDKLGHVGPP